MLALAFFALELAFLGVLLVGVWMIYVPAALIAAGIAGMVSCELWSRQMARAAALKAAQKAKTGAKR